MMMMMILLLIAVFKYLWPLTRIYGEYETLKKLILN